MEELFRQFMAATTKRFDYVDEQLSDLKAFKKSMLADSKQMSMKTSAAISAVSAVVIHLLDLWARKP